MKAIWDFFKNDRFARHSGIELLDIRFKRINYTESVQQSVFQRMIAEQRA